MHGAQSTVTTDLYGGHGMAAQEAAAQVAEQEQDHDGRRGKRTAEVLQRMADKATAKAYIAQEIADNKSLPKKLVDAIKLLVNVDNIRQPNSLYTRIISFIMGNKVQGVDYEPPKKGAIVDDITLFRAFRVAATDMNKVIYQGQDNGIWISAVKKGVDILYRLVAEQEEMPEDYPGPIRTKRSKKDGGDGGDNEE